MFSAIRRRFTFANLATILALVFAMSGGAYAAKHYLITSTKQISPKVLKALKGSRGPAGPQGIAGTAGERGPQGPKGDSGAPGALGEKGAAGESVTGRTIPTGTSACKGMGGIEYTLAGKSTSVCNGQTGFTETLPSGKTEKGQWAVQVPAANPTQGVPVPRSAVSFVIPLEAAPEAHVITNDASTTECPGTASDPQAGPGQLCVYVQFALNAGEPFVASSSPFGFFVGPIEHAEPGGVAGGSWAVTA